MTLPLPPVLNLAVTPAEYDVIVTGLTLVASLRERLAGQVQQQRARLAETRRREEIASERAASRMDLEDACHE